MRKQPKQRSVGIQSADFTSSEFQTLSRTYKLNKKSGFKNLLQPSVTVVPEGSREDIEISHLSREYHSKSIQVDTEAETDFQRNKYSNQNVENSLEQQSVVLKGGSKTPTSKVIKITERVSSNPGPSRMVPGVYSSTSVITQVNEMYLQRHEGSLAVVFGRGSKEGGNSVTSSHPHYFESQGARRLSDETVLLIEDYQSYDQENVAGRQESLSTRRENLRCCARRTHSSTELLARPLPVVQSDGSEMHDEMVCRICHDGEETEPLIQPCLCKGSIGCVHASCLKEWLEQSNSSRCELCNYPYAIRQAKKYSKCYSVRVFYRTVIDRRSVAYDVTSFVIITPLTLVGVVMCIQASWNTTLIGGEANGSEMSYVTRLGMFMLSGTIGVAYGIWLYTLISYHYKAWKKWYSTCYDVEVIPVRLTSEERLEAARELNQEMRNRRVSSGQTAGTTSVLHSPPAQHTYQRGLSVN